MPTPLPIYQLSSDTDHFRCDRYRSVLSARSCAARQQRARDVSPEMVGRRDPKTGQVPADIGLCRSCHDGQNVTRMLRHEAYVPPAPPASAQPRSVWEDPAATTPLARKEPTSFEELEALLENSTDEARQARLEAASCRWCQPARVFGFARDKDGHDACHRHAECSTRLCHRVGCKRPQDRTNPFVTTDPDRTTPMCGPHRRAVQRAIVRRAKKEGTPT
jgi:hypothetical protein